MNRNSTYTKRIRPGRRYVKLDAIENQRQIKIPAKYFPSLNDFHFIAKEIAAKKKAMAILYPREKLK